MAAPPCTALHWHARYELSMLLGGACAAPVLAGWPCGLGVGGGGGGGAGGHSRLTLGCRHPATWLIWPDALPHNSVVCREFMLGGALLITPKLDDNGTDVRGCSSGSGGSTGAGQSCLHPPRCWHAGGHRFHAPPPRTAHWRRPAQPLSLPMANLRRPSSLMFVFPACAYFPAGLWYNPSRPFSF